MKEHRERKNLQVDTSNAKMTFADAAVLPMQRIDENITLKKRTGNVSLLDGSIIKLTLGAANL